MPRKNQRSQAAKRKWQNWKASKGIYPLPSETQKKKKKKKTQDFLDLPVCKEGFFDECAPVEWSPSRVQEEPEPPQIKEEHLHYSLDLPECKEEVFYEPQERRSSLVQDEPEPPQIEDEYTHYFQEEWSSSLVQEEPEPPQLEEEQQAALLQRAEEDDGSTSSLPAVESDGDDDDDENIETDGSTSSLTLIPAVESVWDDESRETEPPASSTSTEHMKTQASLSDWLESRETMYAQLLASHCSKSDTTYCDEREETEGHKTVHIGTKNINLNRKEDKNTSKDLDCKVCGKTFKYKISLKKHMATHSCEEEIPFVCQVCGKGFIASREFKEAHKDTHRINF